MAPRIRPFGPYTLDLDRGELRRGEEIVGLMPKDYALLVYLVEHRDRLVTKEELLDAVWPDTHVADGSLARAIANVRRALGDDSHEPRYIRTLARRGYRFIAGGEDDATAPSASPFGLVCEGTMFTLRMGENILGRGSESLVPIASPAVSRRHAIVTATVTGAVLRDLGSKNGTLVDGRRVREPVTLREGEKICLGPIVLLFRAAAQDRSTVTEVTRAR